MIEMAIQPHEGIGPIKLGATRFAVRTTMAESGYPLCGDRDELDYFCESAIQVEYDTGTASFIGVSSHLYIQCTFRGTDVFDTPAEDLFRLVSRFEGEPTHVFNPLEYCFPCQIVSLWEADEQYHLSEPMPVYGQVGIGDNRYLEAIKEIEKGRTTH